MYTYIYIYIHIYIYIYLYICLLGLPFYGARSAAYVWHLCMCIVSLWPPIIWGTVCRKSVLSICIYIYIKTVRLSIRHGDTDQIDKTRLDTVSGCRPGDQKPNRPRTSGRPWPGKQSYHVGPTWHDIQPTWADRRHEPTRCRRMIWHELTRPGISLPPTRSFTEVGHCPDGIIFNHYFNTNCTTRGHPSQNHYFRRYYLNATCTTRGCPCQNHYCNTGWTTVIVISIQMVQFAYKVY